MVRDKIKNSSSRRAVPIIQPLREALEAAPRKGDYVVNVTEGMIRRHYQAAAEKAGVPYVGAHGLRHSCASLLHANGVSMKEIQEWLGHSDISTTLNIYTHLDYSSKVASANAILDVFPT